MSIITVLSLIKKYWPFIGIALVVLIAGCVVGFFAIKLSMADKKISKLEKDIYELEATNSVLRKEIATGVKQQITVTNFMSSATKISNISDYTISNDVIESLNAIFENYRFDLNNNTLGGNK